MGETLHRIPWHGSTGFRKSPAEQCANTKEFCHPAINASSDSFRRLPTYFWPQWLALETLAAEFGLRHQDAQSALRAMTVGAVEMLTSSQLTAEEVVDLIPVKPLADFEPELRNAYRSRLIALYDKIHP